MLVHVQSISPSKTFAMCRIQNLEDSNRIQSALRDPQQMHWPLHPDDPIYLFSPW